MHDGNGAEELSPASQLEVFKTNCGSLRKRLFNPQKSLCFKVIPAQIMKISWLIAEIENPLHSWTPVELVFKTIILSHSAV